MFAVDLDLSMTCNLYAVTSDDQHILLLSTVAEAALLLYTRLTPDEWHKALRERRSYVAGQTAAKRLKNQ